MRARAGRRVRGRPRASWCSVLCCCLAGPAGPRAGRSACRRGRTRTSIASPSVASLDRQTAAAAGRAWQPGSPCDPADACAHARADACAHGPAGPRACAARFALGPITINERGWLTVEDQLGSAVPGQLRSDSRPEYRGWPGGGAAGPPARRGPSRGRWRRQRRRGRRRRGRMAAAAPAAARAAASADAASADAAQSIHEQCNKTHHATISRQTFTTMQQ